MSSTRRLPANKFGCETREGKNKTDTVAKRARSPSTLRKPGRPKKKARYEEEVGADEVVAPSSSASPSPISPSVLRVPNQISIPIFNGNPDEDLEQWLAELKIKLYGTQDQNFKIEVLKAFTSGRARELLTSVSHLNDFELLIEELRKSFLPQTPSHFVKILSQTKREPTEILEHFSIRVGDLVNKAFPTDDKNILERMRMEYFINGLNADLAQLVRNRLPKNLEKALKYAHQYEGEKWAKSIDKPKKSNNSDAKPIRLATASGVSGKENDNDNDKNMCDQLKEEIEKLRSHLKSEIDKLKFVNSRQHERDSNAKHQGFPKKDNGSKNY